ncbi:MAG: divalent cation tolerance protein CutA [Candidatus Kerfeldbacteria bacterium]|nr:divalent cation tolerance protein CutA [Candidatus Kerfeldbacteria bacterium]
MAHAYRQVIISATSKKEAESLSALLLKKRLIAGSLIIHGPSQYWWQRKIVKKTYYNIQAFTVSSKKKTIIAQVKRYHSDRAPIIAFVQIDGNTEFKKWIDESVHSQTSNVILR